MLPGSFDTFTLPMGELPLDFPALTSRPSSPLRSKSTSPRPSKLVLASSPGSFSSNSDTLYSPRSARSGSFHSTSGTLSGFEDNLGDQEVDIVDIFGGIEDIGVPDVPGAFKFGGKAVVRQAFLKPRVRLLGLPWELNVRIFGLLDQIELLRISRVCRKFQRLAADGHLWASIDLSHHYRHVPAQQVIRLFENAGEFLQYANLRGCCHVPATSLSFIAKHSPHISHLDLQGCTSLTGTALVQILSGLRRLKTVDLAGLGCVNDRCLLVLGRSSGEMLEKCGVGFCKGVSSAGVRNLIRHTPNLTNLGIAFLPVDDTTLEHLGRNVPHLQILDARGCAQLTSHGITACLHAMALTGHPDRIGDDNDADRPVQTGIVKLHLSQIPGLDDTVLTAISKRCRLLEALEVAGTRGVSDTGLDSLSSCAQLRHLDVEECVSVTDVGLGHVARLALLECLSMGGNDRVSNAGVAAVLGGCRALKTLDLSGCGGITDGLLERVVAMRVRARTPLRAVGVGVMTAADSGYVGDATGIIATSLTSTQNAPMTPPTTHLKLVEVYDCRHISQTACKDLERRGGVQVRSFWSNREGRTGGAGVLNGDGVAGAPGVGGVGRARRRRGFCVVM